MIARVNLGCLHLLATIGKDMFAWLGEILSVWIDVICYNEVMKESEKTIEQRPNKWEIWSQRIRNLGILTLGLGALLGIGGVVLMGGTGAVVGEGFRQSESGLRQAKTKHKVEEKK